MGVSAEAPEILPRRFARSSQAPGSSREVLLGSSVLALLLAAGCSPPASTTQTSLASVGISPTAALVSVGDSVALRAVVRDSSGHVIGDASVTWTSSDPQAAGISATGLVSAIGAGATTITAAANGLSATALVKVVGVTAAKAITNGDLIWLGPNTWKGLFATDSAWSQVQARTHVVKLYVDDVNGAFPAALAAAVATLNQAHIAVAVEVGGVRDWNCSGEALATIESEKIAKFIDAGGAVSFLDLDSPFGHTIATGIPGNCGFSVAETSAQLVAYIQMMRHAFPGVRIGLIEPVPWYSVGAHPANPGNNFGDLPQLLDTFQTTLAAANEHIDYFHADAPYDYDQANPTGWFKLVSLAAAVRGHGWRFGLIYNSDTGGRTGDQPFHDQTLASFAAFKAAGGRSDDVLVQSWYPFPSMMVPETQSFTFTNVAKNLIAAYDAP